MFAADMVDFSSAARWWLRVRRRVRRVLRAVGEMV